MFLILKLDSTRKCLTPQVKEILVDVSDKIELQNHIILSIDVILKMRK